MTDLPTSIPAARTMLSGPALLAYVNERYRLDAIRCDPWLQGLNDTYIVRTANERFVLRVYTLGWRTDNDVAFELELLEHLKRQDAPVAAPIRSLTSELFSVIKAPEGQRQVALFEYVEGKAVAFDEMTIEACRSYGEAAAQIHTAMDTYQPKRRRFALDMRHLLDEPQIPLKPLLADRMDDWADIAILADELRTLVFRLDAKGLTHGLCHGDLHGGNARQQDDGSFSLFDFDCCGEGWRAHDIAVFRWNLGVHDSLTNEDELWAAFLEGYRSHRELSALDEAAVPLFATIRQIWLLGLHAHLGEKIGTAFMNRRYFDRQLAQMKRWSELALAINVSAL